MRRLSSFVALLLATAGLALAGPVGTADAATLTVCPSGCAYDSVGAAVAAASAGDTITVAAGTYTEPATIHVTMPLTITGAGAGATIVDGAGTASPIFDLRPGPHTGVGVITVSNMTLRNAGSGFDVVVKANNPTTDTTAMTLDSLDIDATGTSLAVYASGGPARNGAERVAPAFTMKNTTVTGQGGNAVQLDTYFGATTLRGNHLAEGSNGNSAIDVYNEYSTAQNAYPLVIDGNTSDGRLVYAQNFTSAPFNTYGGLSSIAVTNNTISNLSAADPGIFVGTASTDGALATRVGTATVTGNRIRGNGSTASAGVQIAGYVEHAAVTGNDIVGVGDAVRVSTVSGQSAGQVAVNKNRLFADTNGVANATSAAVDANGNWWGCQDGPAATTAAALAYCSRAANTGGGSIGVANWVVNTVATDKSSLAFGSNDVAHVSGTLSRLNTGATANLPDFFQGLPAAFAAAHGSVSPAAATLDGSLGAGTTYSMPSSYSSTDTVTVALDGATVGGHVVTGQPVVVPLTIKPAPLLSLVVLLGSTTGVTASVGNLFGGVLLNAWALLHF